MEPVAILGIGCRFPGAEDPRAFWRLLHDGIDAVTEAPRGRWEQGEGSWGGFLPRLDLFDAAFFGISPREARQMDPQQRLLLEVSWEALENAGQPADRLAGSRTGVFVGTMNSEYGQALMADPATIDVYAGSNGHSLLANRVSYHFNFHGPSVTVDTACSSSLVAVHTACRSLAAGECDLALAGGVNVLLSPALSAFYVKAGLASPDGRCRSFDARANGIVRGEGAGAVVLKRLADALAAGDPILAVIRGGAVNHDGQSNGIMAPNRWAQEAVLREAYRVAGVSPGEVQYVEAHGTGTLLGDPIEAKALGAVLAEGRPAGSACAIGSVKSNFGHLEGAAGVAGLIKAVLALHHRAVPPSLHFESPNSHIPFAELPLRVQTALAPWPGEPGARALAGVSSFGLGGTNAHLVLEGRVAWGEERASREDDAAGSHLLPLSARTPEALTALAGSLRSFVADGGPGAGLAPVDLSYTLGARRAHHPYRASVVFGSRGELLDRLDVLLRQTPDPAVRVGKGRAGRRPKLAFVFSGQGPQTPGMGRELLAGEPAFRAALEACDATLRPHLGWSVIDEIVAEPERSRLDQTEVAQPALFAVQVALAALWCSWGIEPDMVAGHSMGEVAAAHVAGILDLAEAARIIAHRGRLMQRATGQGRMLALSLGAAEAEEVLRGSEGRVAIAAVNGPALTVLSGDSEALERVAVELSLLQISCRFLPVDYAFHHPGLAPLGEELARVLEGCAPGASAIPFVSSHLGRVATGAELGAAYWAKGVSSPVRFAEAVGVLSDQGCSGFLEIGPHPVLVRAVEQCLGQRGQVGFVLPSLRHGAERSTLLGSVGELYVRGQNVAWDRLAGGPHRCVPLPAYPWQRQSYWRDTTPAAPATSGSEGRPPEAPGTHPLLGAHLRVAGPTDLDVWERALGATTLSYLQQHRIQGAVVLPGAAYLEMAQAAAREAVPNAFPVLEDVHFERALFLDRGERRVQTLMTAAPGKDAAFEVHSAPAGAAVPRGAWTLHARGRIAWRAAIGAGEAGAEVVDLEALRTLCRQEVSLDAYHERLERKGFEWGPAFRGIERLWRGRGEALALVRVPPALASETPAYQLHPAVLDACLRVAGVSLAEAAERGGGEAYMPTGVRRFRLVRAPEEQLWSHARVWSGGDGGDSVEADLWLYDSAGRLVAELSGLTAQRLGSGTRESRLPDLTSWLYELAWQPLPEHSPGTAQRTAEGAWLILADRGGVGEALARQGAERGVRCGLALPGTDYERQGVDRFTVNPDSTEGLQLLLSDVGPLRGVVCLWSLDATAPAGTATAAEVEAQALTSGRVAPLVRELSTRFAGRVPRLWLVTSGAQPVLGDAAGLAIGQAPLWGLGRALAAENPALWGGLVDLDPAAATETSAAALWDEIHGADGEDQVALRHGRRYAARLLPARQAAEPCLPLVWRADASYLITGGLGDLGLLVAGWMVEQGARRLILLGRSGLPDRRLWSAVPAEDPAHRRIARIRSLEAKGASVHVAAVDVADEGEMAAYLDAHAREQWPPIRGVVHAAGVLRDGEVADLRPEALREVLRPKVAGGWLLSRLFKDAGLDFFVLFSSASALLSSPRLGAYAAANAFLDALAHRCRAEGIPALGIDWGAWADLGLARSYEAGRGAGRTRAAGSLSAAQGLALLGRLMDGGATQVGVLPVDWERWRRSYPALAGAPLLSALLGPEVAAAAPEAGHQLSIAELCAAAPERRQGLVEELLRGLAARALELSPAQVDVRRSLSELGFDSLMAVEVKHRIEKDLAVVVPIVKFLEVNSVTELAGWIAEAMAVAPETVAATAAELAAVVGAVEDPRELLDRLDQLSAEELDALLGGLIAESEGRS